MVALQDAGEILPAQAGFGEGLGLIGVFGVAIVAVHVFYLRVHGLQEIGSDLVEEGLGVVGGEAG